MISIRFTFNSETVANYSSKLIQILFSKLKGASEASIPFPRELFDELVEGLLKYLASELWIMPSRDYELYDYLQCNVIATGAPEEEYARRGFTDLLEVRIKLGREDVNLAHLCEIAAKYGHLDCMKIAFALGAPLDIRACVLAARYGHLNCLNWARSRGSCPLANFASYPEFYRENPEERRDCLICVFEPF